jgi:hypothetical protein
MPRTGKKALRIPLIAAGLGALVAGSPLVSTVSPAAPKAAQFVTPCGFSHRAPDDPIVAPGRPGASHSHDFFGNASTRASSTYASLRRAATLCRRPADTAAYWVPTLYRNGRAVTPSGAQIYYRAGGKAPSSVRAFPAGLKVIAGDSNARSPQPTRVTSWHCGPGSGVDNRSQVPTCPTGYSLRLRVRFPDCWDGRRLDSANHKSHLAYSARRRCPGSHPTPVPLLALNIRYPISGGSGVTLSSGSQYSAHADFFNAWNQEELRRLVRRCINGGPVEQRPPCTAPRRR